MKRVIVERNRYFDSVFLLRISSELDALAGVRQAVVAMATPINVDSLIDSGFALDEEPTALRPADLLIAIDAESADVMATAQEQLAHWLSGRADAGAEDTAVPPISLGEALAADSKINLALISVPGIHAAREARQALRRGLHVMLFSDNVPIKDEIELKDDAIERGLLMMGPDCGTAILNGAALGFANSCRRGTVGLVGASGTGIQEISSLVHRLGGGISQAIGTGGRDLSEDVDGRMTRFGIQALGDDSRTRVIVVVSKTPSSAVAERVIATLARTGKPSVIHFIGERAKKLSAQSEMTATLADAALAAVIKAGVDRPRFEKFEAPEAMPAVAGRLVGLFCGGTLCQETWSLLLQAGFDVRSNVAADAGKRVRPESHVPGHVVWDLGDDAFTVGRPHPMIAPSLRDDRVAAAGADPSVGLILADCVIGYGAHEDPAGSLAGAARRALDAAQRDGRRLAIVASVTGTEQDPQNLDRQQHILRDAGITVAPSNAAAARTAAAWLKGGTS